MGESYSSSMILLIQTISLYNPGLPQISQLIKTDLIFPNVSLDYVEDSCCLFAPVGPAHKGVHKAPTRVGSGEGNNRSKVLPPQKFCKETASNPGPDDSTR
jgi:hypothetical protein